MRDLTFNEVCQFIKGELPEHIEDVSSLLSLVMALSSPVLLSASPFDFVLGTVANLFQVKGDLSQVFKRIVEKLAETETDSASRQLRMEAAYGLICYTAFFEAVEQSMPKAFKAVDLSFGEKLSLAKSALEKVSTSAPTQQSTEKAANKQTDLTSIPLQLPHPAESFTSQISRLRPLYSELAKGFQAFLESLAFWEEANEKQKAGIRQAMEKLVQQSLDYFRGQYYVLSVKYHEFYVWSNLQEHAETRKYLDELSEFVRKHVSLFEGSKKTVDIGFTSLSDLIQSIPARIEAEKADKIFEELDQIYVSKIGEPVIRDTFVPDEGKIALSYPKKKDIFIPQSYKVIRYTGKERLESEYTWSTAASRNDLGAFLVSYFSSPHSQTTPLIILGHPGSGKSLLSSMLAARMSSATYRPIYVELRSVNAENDIPIQIEEQINNDTGRRVPWANITDHLGDRHPVIILDGYDELLQASGKAFAGYIKQVQQFQQNEISRKRPHVHVVITSRITLIDKAHIPVDSTVVRLLEFDSTKRTTWINEWNKVNAHYFEFSGLEPFDVPEKDRNIVALAEQPLLLLMLALYDSDANELRKIKNLDQAVLFNSLLRRFVERERLKNKRFLDLTKREQEIDIDRELQRLGVVATGMFNRRALHITSVQLNEDLRFFRLERADIDDRRLTQADLLLGSFFFVYESRSLKKMNEAGEREQDAAFEFLHNTFGEFLTADFILRRLFDEVQSVIALSQTEILKSQLEHKLASPDGFAKEWYACLMYTPLFSRPLIPSMVREWFRHLLIARNISEEDFLHHLDIILTNQIKKVLAGGDLPVPIIGADKGTFGMLPVLGHLCVYSLNLILLRALLSTNPYTFDENVIKPFEDGTRTWDRLTHLWRSWFSLDTLNGLTAIMTAKRNSGRITIEIRDKFATASNRDRLDAIYNVGVTLADNITSGLSGYILLDRWGGDSFDRNSSERMANDVTSMLSSERIELEISLMAKQFRRMRRIGSDTGFIEHTRTVFQYILSVQDRQVDTGSFFVECFSEMLRTANDFGYSYYIRDFVIEYLNRAVHYNYYMSLLVELAIVLRQESPDLLRSVYDDRFREMLVRSSREAQRQLSLNLELLKVARTLQDRMLGDSVYNMLWEAVRAEIYDKDINPEIVIEIIRAKHWLQDDWPVSAVLDLVVSYCRRREQRTGSYYIDHYPAVHEVRMILTEYVSFLRNNAQRYQKFIQDTLGEVMEMVERYLPNTEYLRNADSHELFLREDVQLLLEISSLARSVNHKPILNYLHDRYFRKYLMQLQDQELYKFSQPIIAEAIRVARNLNDKELLERLLNFAFQDFFQRYRLDQVAVVLAVEILQLSREFGNIQLLKGFYDSHLAKNSLTSWPLELALEVVTVAQLFNDSRFTKYTFLSEGKQELGVIRWFDPSKGYGFIERSEGGDIYFNASDVIADVKLLENGRLVEYQITREGKKPRAKAVNILRRDESVALSRHATRKTYDIDLAVNKRTKPSAIPRIGEVFTGRILDIDDTAVLVQVPGFSQEQIVGVIPASDTLGKRYRIGYSARVEVVAERKAQSGRIIIELRPSASPVRD